MSIRENGGENRVSWGHCFKIAVPSFLVEGFPDVALSIDAYACY
jgi:hypothetical protein